MNHSRKSTQILASCQTRGIYGTDSEPGSPGDFGTQRQPAVTCNQPTELKFQTGLDSDQISHRAWSRCPVASSRTGPHQLSQLSLCGKGVGSAPPSPTAVGISCRFHHASMTKAQLLQVRSRGPGSLCGEHPGPLLCLLVTADTMFTHPLCISNRNTWHGEAV